MKKETKAVKEILKSKYTKDKFKLKYVESNSYLDTSDKIIVFCEENVNLEDVKDLLKKYTKGIVIYIQDEKILFGCDCDDRKIYSIDMSEFIKVDLLKNIEIKNRKL